MKKILFVWVLIMMSPAWAAAGSITGTIKWEGKVPKFRPIKMDADPVCVTHHDGPVFPQTLILGDDQTMANVFVRVTAGVPKKKFETPTEPAVLDQKGCEYSPHVLGVMVNQPIKILNPDGTLHNVHALPKINGEFNLAMPKFRKEVTKVFDKEEFMFPIKCDVHPWMGAWVSVMSHPFFDTTETDGVYTIEGLPAGEYQIEAWHEKLGVKTAKVKVTADDMVTHDFTYSRPEKP